jgi:cyclic beta-1,2-glucan synthetase
LSGIHSSATLQRSPSSRYYVKNYFSARVAGGFVGAILLLLTLLVTQIRSVRYDFTIYRLIEHHPTLILVTAIIGAFLGFEGLTLVGFGVRRSLITRLMEWVTAGETFVIVNVRVRDIPRTLNSLRENPEDLPAIFVFHGEQLPFTPLPIEPVAVDDVTSDRLASRARTLAESQSVGGRRKPNRVLLERLTDSGNAFSRVSSHLKSAVRNDQRIELSAEWLLDNAYIVRGHIEEYRENLPRNFYRELPVLSEGTNTGLPRVYEIAQAFVNETQARVTVDEILAYLLAYQVVTPLTMGELWALPLMLRLALVEFLHEIIDHVERRQVERELAEFWANRLMTASRNQPELVQNYIAHIARIVPNPSPSLAREMINNLSDNPDVITPLRTWLDNVLGMAAPDAINQERNAHAIQQLSLVNTLSSLRLLSSSDWTEIFERVSVVDLILRTDPASIFHKMDYATRDYYRKAVERLSRRSKSSETDVADAAIRRSEAATIPLERHVGYHLIDRGRVGLESDLAYRVSIRQNIQRQLSERPALSYVTPIIVLTILFVFIVSSYAVLADSPWLVPLALFALFPCSEIAVALVNTLMTRIFEPDLLPKMSFDDGIPEEFRTLVVVPMMLLTPESIQQEIDRLEVRALANLDPNLQFALLSDFSDAERQSMPEDAERLEIAKRGIERLGSRFLLFHRNREWSESEQRWMGWERKRGKLEDLNDYLTNNRNNPRVANLLCVGDENNIRDIRFILTLDADTQLPRDTGKKLVATLSHPLNQPVFTSDGSRLERGFTLIQPRVMTSLPSATETRFSRTFTDSHGIDPYNHAVSDVYQDLSGEGIYHGKGIYDLASFRKLLSGRFPDEHLLSHDLIEGAHSRVALATDVELLDSFPSSPYSYTRREHRWIRGDWQIADWIFDKVPTKEGGRVDNPLSLLNRWKIFDNLRRSLVAPAYVVLLMASLIVAPRTDVWLWTVAWAMLTPILIQLFLQLTSSQWYRIFRGHEPWGAVLRAVVWTSLLPYQAFNAVDAIARVAYRRFFTRRLLLEWETAHQVNQSAKTQNRSAFWHMLWIPAVSLPTLVLVTARHSIIDSVGLVILLLWSVSPLLSLWLGNPDNNLLPRDLSITDRRLLRHIALRTWMFFDHFVGESSNWLPPDNYQEDLTIEVARRTSPTNVGMWLLSTIAAQDLGFVTLTDAVHRAQATFATLLRLEKYEGHLLNWYETDTCQAMHPRYVSMVDSGNLLGALWALDQSYATLEEKPFATPSVFEAILDTVALMIECPAPEPPVAKLTSTFKAIQRECALPATNINGYVSQIRSLDGLAMTLRDILDRDTIDTTEIYTLATQLCTQVRGWNVVADSFLEWVDLLRNLPQNGLLSLGRDVHLWRRQALASNPSLSSLANGQVTGMRALLSLRGQPGIAPDADQWLTLVDNAYLRAQNNARDLLRVIDGVRTDCRSIADSMNMKFLYVHERRLFAVGYNVEDARLDSFYYDLLASEARLGSFAAIARGEVPVEHWFSLGRPMGIAYGERVLLSWSGTMFEYLMPSLLTRNFDNSLLDHACRSAVAAQIRYGRKRGVPWGISEAGHSAVDARQIYQYHAFGVPGLGLKRDLEDDLVVAPYATALALVVDPKVALQNLRRLASMSRPRKRGTDSLLGPFGFYESIDYSRQRDKEGVRGVIVRSYMAHHQGMSLLAIDNALNENIMQTRFHADLRVRSTESLLYERIPTGSLKPVVDAAAPSNLNMVEPTSSVSDIRFDTPNTVTPRTHLLSNNEYNILVTNSGGGYSRWKNIEIVRWRADTVTDHYGSFCYIKDVGSGNAWSAAFHPMDQNPENYNGFFTVEKAELHCKHAGIEVITEIVVSPEDNAEVRRMTLVNRSSRERTLELTSYLELALADHAADRSHPAFSKLFVETEAVPEIGALIAHRRPRTANEASPWAAHVVSSSKVYGGSFQFETDREKFIGRGRSLASPKALDSTLSGGVGAVLDPIFSLRRVTSLKPGERSVVSFITVAGESKDVVLRLATKYSQPEASERAHDLAWTDAQLSLRQLRIQPEDAIRCQVLASQLIYPDSRLRPSDDTLRQNNLPRTRLWAYGISGDLPIAVMLVRGTSEVEVVRQAVRAHVYWNAKGLKTDLVIIDQEPASYAMPLMDRLSQIIDSSGDVTGRDRPGGVFLRSATQIAPDDLTLLLSVAHIVLNASRGSLAQQLSITSPPAPVGSLTIKKSSKDSYSSPLPFMDLKFFNGLGGFTADGKEYVTYLGDGISTPAPWINVMANENFGTLISETGSGFTWAVNSQMNRITPWSNDPVTDPSNDAIYIHDDDVGVSWTPTASPIREHDAYRARHGQGYSIHEHNSHGIEQELTTFVPVNDHSGDPIRVQILRLKNASSQTRRLTLTSYVTWVLGTTREETQMSVTTDWENTTGTLLARNQASPSFGTAIAFMSASTTVTSYTGDRSEFIGRNRSLSSPDVLNRTRLSNRVGASIDPCGAIQTRVEIEPGATEEVVFVLGQAATLNEVKNLVHWYCDSVRARQSLEETVQWWDRVLSTVHVELPDDNADVLVNRWLLYQSISCRVWGRSAFYQSGGAFGFRDQLQDVMAVVYSLPDVARKQIIASAARQFVEGDVQHWWHMPGGAGVRTRISDDLLWLPFVTAQYVRVTGDIGILDEYVPFIDGHVLAEGEDEAFFVPEVSKESATVLEHCKRALKKGLALGTNGLPLIGTGDWNDGLNKVGAEGKGESVWLAWFIVHVLNDMAELVSGRGETVSAAEYHRQATSMAASVEEYAWDGDWYLRGIYDDGTPLGSNASEEMKIDSLPQSWGIISGAARPERSARAMQAVIDQLVDEKAGLVKLFTPAFDKTSKDPGYIKGYVAGVRENGGQYTHGSLWTPMALARSGNGEEAVRLLDMMSPITHGSDPSKSPLYRVEPYVVVADIYALQGQEGRGGWTWYTGSASWMYRIWLEEILGFKKRGNRLELDPQIPKSWPEFCITYRYMTSTYEITYKNGEKQAGESHCVEVDGRPIDDTSVDLIDDGKTHVVTITCQPQPVPQLVGAT